MCWWWLPSPAALIPVGYKQEGRREATNNNCNTDNNMLPSSRSPSRWSLQRHLFPGNTMTTSRSVHASDAAKVNTSTITGVVHSCTAFGRLGSCVHVGSQRWGYALTANDNKAESPSVPQGWQCCQMCFPPSYWKFVSHTWSKLTAELVVQARVHRSSYSEHTCCPLPVLIDTLMQLRNSIIFIDEALLVLQRKALKRHVERASRD